MCGGFVKNWSGMVAIRAIIGALEAGFFPGCVYLISTWYSRYDMQKRYAVFYLLGCVASAFVGILSYGIMQMVGDILSHGVQDFNANVWSIEWSSRN